MSSIFDGSNSIVQSVALQPSNVNVQVLFSQEKALALIQASLMQGYSPNAQALDDIEDFLSNDIYDYSAYVIQQDNKVLANATKLLMLSNFLFKLLN